jgi:hypothetical protein
VHLEVKLSTSRLVLNVSKYVISGRVNCLSKRAANSRATFISDNKSGLFAKTFKFKT